MSIPDFDYLEVAVANHLTPSELADQLQMKRQEVIGKCVEMHVPIYHGRIDKSLFRSTLQHSSPQPGERPAQSP